MFWNLPFLLQLKKKQNYLKGPHFAWFTNLHPVFETNAVLACHKKPGSSFGFGYVQRLYFCYSCFLPRIEAGVWCVEGSLWMALMAKLVFGETEAFRLQ